MPHSVGFVLGCFSWLLAGLFYPSEGLCGHPLVTDDSGTQGRGGFQIELNGMIGHDRERGATETLREVGTILSYGLSDTVDAVFGIPYRRIRIKDDEGAMGGVGLSDLSLDLKWRFHEQEGLGLALRLGVTFPTGDEKKALGTGRPTYGPFLIATKEISPWTFHLNLGYRRNENRLTERKDIWCASLASEFEARDKLKLVSDIGVQRNTDGTARTHPVFLILGIIYSLTSNLDVNFGIQLGLTGAETDYVIHPGVALRFALE